MFIGAFRTAKKVKTTKYLQTHDGQIHKTWYSHSMCYSTVKKNSTTQMSLKNIMLSQRSQSYCMTQLK